MKTTKTSTFSLSTANQELTERLLEELHQCFSVFQDGLVKDDTFLGGLPMSYLNGDGSLVALTRDESRKIRRALTISSSGSKGALPFSLSSLIHWVPLLKESDKEQSKNGDDTSSPEIIDSSGKLLPLPEGVNLNCLIEKKLNEQGLQRYSAYWYAISEELEKKRVEERVGDLSQIDLDRRKLTAKRFNATPFERAAQNFSAHVSSRFCDANGDVVCLGELEEFTNQLVDYLLEKTKPYWPIAPLLSIFDAVVVPVLRPLLYPHITWASDHNFFSERGVFDVRQLANKRTPNETTPTWNETAQQQALHFIEEALKHQLSLSFFGFRLFDTFSPYNRSIHSSVHIDPSEFRGNTKIFGPPVHAQDVMRLVQPIPQKPEDALVDKVMTYRSPEEGVWH